jgi:hypothetical protein
MLLSITIANVNVNAQFIDETYTQINNFVDPTFTDNGFQIGLEIEKIMKWGYVNVSISHYQGLEIPYNDLVGSLGINYHLFQYSRIRYYNGFRLGYIKRERTFPMVGGVVGFDFKLKHDNETKGFRIGFRLWIDYREGQKAQFYGDYDAYKPGLITNTPLLQENGAFVFSYSF